MSHGEFDINTRDSAGLVLRNLIEMKPRAIGKRGLVPEVRRYWGPAWAFVCS